MANDRKIAIVTGANSGVGYGIVERLLEWDCDNLTVVLACRNEARAMVAWQSLLQEFPKAKMDILIVDLGNCESVLKACKRVFERYKFFYIEIDMVVQLAIRKLTVEPN